MRDLSNLVGLLGLITRFTSSQRPQPQQSQSQPQVSQGINKVNDSDLNNFVDLFMKLNNRRR